MAKLSDSVSRQYAKSFFEVSNKNDALPSALKDILLLKEIINKSIEFQSFIKNPLISTNKQQAFFDLLTKNGKLSTSTQNLLKLLCLNKRLSYLNEILKDFVEIANDAQNKMVGTVISAKELTPIQKSDLEDALGRLLQKQVVLKTVHDPQILGGLRIHVGSYIFDGSLKHQLDVLATTLEKVSINGT